MKKQTEQDKDIIREELTKAFQGMELVISDLNEVNKKSTMVMSELLIMYMGEARILHNKIKNLYNSFIVDEGT